MDRRTIAYRAIRLNAAGPHEPVAIAPRHAERPAQTDELRLKDQLSAILPSKRGGLTNASQPSSTGFSDLPSSGGVSGRPLTKWLSLFPLLLSSVTLDTQLYPSVAPTSCAVQVNSMHRQARQINSFIYVRATKERELASPLLYWKGIRGKKARIASDEELRVAVAFNVPHGGS